MTRFVLLVALLVPSIASAQYRGDVPLGDTLNFTFNTVGSTGAPITIAGTPAIEVYEEGSITQITAGTTLTEDFDGVTGLHNVAIVATGANGYEAGKWYDVVIAGTTPTADSVSILGRTLGTFRVVVAENVSGTPAVDVELIEGTAASTSLASAADIVNEWETQSQADPTGFHVNVMEWDSATTVVDNVTTAFGTTLAEPTGVPAADAPIWTKIGYLYMALRNQVDVTATKKQYYDDGGAIEWEKDLSDNGTTYSETEGNAP